MAKYIVGWSTDRQIDRSALYMNKKPESLKWLLDVMEPVLNYVKLINDLMMSKAEYVIE